MKLPMKMNRTAYASMGSPRSDAAPVMSVQPSAVVKTHRDIIDVPSEPQFFLSHVSHWPNQYTPMMANTYMSMSSSPTMYTMFWTVLSSAETITWSAAMYSTDRSARSALA